jgi:hypothetical protein
MSHVKNNIEFLSLPENNHVEMTLEQFNHGVKNKIVELVEKLPYNVYQICKAQHNEAKTRHNIDRLKQSATQSGVDSREREK